MSAKKEHFKKILIKWVSVDFVKTLFKLAFSCGKGIIYLFLLRKNLLSYLHPKQDNQFAGRVGTPCIHHVSRPARSEARKFGKVSATNSQNVREFFGCTIWNLWNRSPPAGLDGQLVSLSPTWPIRRHQNSTHGISFDAFLKAYMSEDRPNFARVGNQAQIWRRMIRSKIRLSTECTQAMLVKKTQKLRCKPRSIANAPWRKSRIRTKPIQSHPPQSGQFQADLAHI